MKKKEQNELISKFNLITHEFETMHKFYFPGYNFIFYCSSIFEFCFFFMINRQSRHFHLV